MAFSLRRRRTVSDILLTLFAGLLVFGLSWYHLTHSPTTVSLRLFLILWIVCFCLIAAELVAAVHRSVVLGGETYLYAKNLQGAISSLSSMRPERPRFGISTVRGARWTGTTRLRAIWCKIYTERRMEMGGRYILIRIVILSHPLIKNGVGIRIWCFMLLRQIKVSDVIIRPEPAGTMNWFIRMFN